MGIFIQLLLLAGISLTRSSNKSYPRKVYASECPDLFREGSSLSFAVGISGCTVMKESTPGIKTYSFGEDIRHGSYVMYGPLNNLTFWRQRYVDNRDVKRIGPVLRTTGIQMDATGYAYVYLDDYDPRTMSRLAYLHMECRGDNGGFTPFAQTPGGKLLNFEDIKTEVSQGSLLFYSLYPTWCEPKPKNYTHVYIHAGPLDEYRFDPAGDLVFTYRILNHDLTLDVTTVKMTSSSDITMETYSYSQTTGKSGPLIVKSCTYGESNMFGVYKVPSPQGKH